MWCVVAVVAAVAVAVAGQRAPCYGCEFYKESHLHSDPYNDIRWQCRYPCECGSVPACGAGVPVVMDGCDCCWQCARQEGQYCNAATRCDASKGLQCLYNASTDALGTCQVSRPNNCTVNGTTYAHGETFQPDCRTRCLCQNGTRACTSLCPGEQVTPSAECRNPRLVAVSDQCCREWMCDTNPGKSISPPECELATGRWSECSAPRCGVGVSLRWAMDPHTCTTTNQTRLCQVRPCNQVWKGPPFKATKKHHIRRGHSCKATQRMGEAVRLRAGWCVSERRYRPKYCGDCGSDVSCSGASCGEGVSCCGVHASTTITVAFVCPLHANTDLLSGTRTRHLSPDILARLAYRTPPDVHGSDIHTSDIPGIDQRTSDIRRSYIPVSIPDIPRSIPDIPAPAPATPSVYDMMDEGLAANYLRRPTTTIGRAETSPYQYSRLPTTRSQPPTTHDTDDFLSYDYGNDPKHRSKRIELDDLTTADDEEYRRIKNDHYEVVHHMVEWIVRCKCGLPCPGEATPAYNTPGHNTPDIVPLT